jgi:hypothetical protein
MSRDKQLGLPASSSRAFRDLPTSSLKLLQLCYDARIDSEKPILSYSDPKATPDRLSIDFMLKAMAVSWILCALLVSVWACLYHWHASQRMCGTIAATGNAGLIGYFLGVGFAVRRRTRMNNAEVARGFRMLAIMLHHTVLYGITEIACVMSFWRIK